MGVRKRLSKPGIWQQSGFHTPVWIAFSTLIPVLYLETISFAIGETFSWQRLCARLIFTAGVAALAYVGQPRKATKSTWRLPLPGIILTIAGLVVVLIYLTTGFTWAAWISLATLYIYLIFSSRVITYGKTLWIKGMIYGVHALGAGFVSAAASQIETRFSEEEFFSAIQAIILMVFWFLLALLLNKTAQASKNSENKRDGLYLGSRLLNVLFVILAASSLPGTIFAYQHSFYPRSAPPYEGITSSMPYLCAEIPKDPTQYEGEDIYQRMLALIKANPNKQSPEYGILALQTGDDHWKQAFHDSLLNEAADGRFTLPANSIKYGQYEASMRVYYYLRVKETYPEFFSPEEEAQLKEWFAAINSRSQTVEWVDWLYGLAFSKWPQGPYENQETGAGLISLIEWGGLGDDVLSSTNRNYLMSSDRGWLERFRNTDDAAVYQPEWIYNAYFQSLFTNRIQWGNLNRSFEWLLLQALPDGHSLRYNHLGSANLAGIAYFGADLLGDERYLWLSGRSLEFMETQGMTLSARPGMEKVVIGTGSSPSEGTCLLYGNSGLPNQNGPLAPDKIVFRDGWDTDSSYLLLNLRFTGWHRYKATNTIVNIYQDGYLLNEQYSGETFDWLPSGRSLFRDKRIPRENLNGLAIESSGISKVIRQLTSIGSPWAQDPPYYARVERFETGPLMDMSSTVIENWRGWYHRRTIYFYHNGPIIIIDEAEGPASQQSAIFWHVTGNGSLQEQRITVGEGKSLAEMFLIPIGSGRLSTQIETGLENEPKLQVQYQSTIPGRLQLVTIMLTNEWLGADAYISYDTGETVLHISSKEGARLDLPLPLSDEESMVQ